MTLMYLHCTHMFTNRSDATVSFKHEWPHPNVTCLQGLGGGRAVLKIHKEHCFYFKSNRSRRFLGGTQGPRRIEY